MRRCWITNLVIGYFIFSLALVKADAENLQLSESESHLFSSIKHYADCLGQNLNEDRLLSLITSKKVGQDFSFNTVDVLLEIAHSLGIFLNAYKLSDEELPELALLNIPFITYLDERGWVLVENIVPKNDGGREVNIVVSKEKKIILIEKTFKDKWRKIIISAPLVNVWVKRYKPYSDNLSGRFIIIYAYHFGEDFSKMQILLDKLLREAQEKGKKLIYVDELGLIPSESIKAQIQTQGISEQDAFASVKKSLEQENASIEKGIPIYDSLEFYSQLYSYLAKNKIKVILEDLNYDNWKQMVAFDELGVLEKNELNTLAINDFLSANIKGYIEKKYQHTRGFMQYNVKERDDYFCQQIEKIMAENPDAIIVTLRGIGHYGITERISNQNYSLESLVIGEGLFLRDNLVASEYLQVLWANDIELTPEEAYLLLLRDFPQQILRTYLQRKFESLSFVTRVSSQIVRRMNSEDVINLSNAIYFGFFTKKINKDNLNEFIINWVKEEGFITNEEKQFFN